MGKVNTKIFILITILVTANIVIGESPVNLLLVGLQILWIISLLGRNRIQEALYYHLIFIMTSINSTTNGNIVEEGAALYNYNSLKLIGPISLSYVITLYFAGYALITNKNNYYNINIKPYIKTISVFIYFGISGILLGLWGILFDHYRLESFIGYNIYIWMTILMMVAILKIGSTGLVLRIYETAMPIIGGGIVGSFLAFLLGIRTQYGGLTGLPVLAEITYYSSLMILGLLYCRNIYIYIVILGLYLFLASKNIIGKQVIVLGIALIVVGYQLLFNKMYIKTHVGRSLCLWGVFGIGIFFMSLSVSNSNADSLTSHKIEQVNSIFSIRGGEMAASPATRIGETINFIYNNRANPFALIFGKGYGGYITDDLGLFVGFDLQGGGFSDDQIRSGRYSQLHDTFATVPLLNGFLGLVLLFLIIRYHIRRFKYNYLVFTVIPWLLFTFYFSTQYAFTGAFFLYGSLVDNTYAPLK